jgi:hypothetical protein
MEIGLWRTLWTDETKSIGMGRCMFGSNKGTSIRQDHHTNCQAWRGE